jgi:hypothetical protein
MSSDPLRRIADAAEEGARGARFLERFTVELKSEDKMPNPNAELIGTEFGKPGSLLNPDEFLSIVERYAKEHGVTGNYIELEGDHESDTISVYLEHPEIPIPDCFVGMSDKLRKIALAEPMGGFINSIKMGYIMAEYKRGNLGPAKKWDDRHSIFSTDPYEVRLTLSYRKKVDPKWHLSAMACRFGRLQTWEERQIRVEFKIPDDAKTEKDDDGRVHWMWNDK